MPDQLISSRPVAPRAGTLSPSSSLPPLRRTTAWPRSDGRRRYIAVLITLIVLGMAILGGLLAWRNPMPMTSPGFWRIAELRMTNVGVIVVVAWCQALATVAFHTVTANRIITPSIMGFESLYRVIQTGGVFLFGTAGAAMLQGTAQFLGQVAVMVLFAAGLYGWLLTGRRGNLHVMLLIGIILGGGLGAVATFAQRMLTPSEFDVVAARLMGSIGQARVENLIIAAPVALLAGMAVFGLSSRLDVLSLGREAATGLGLQHRRWSIVVLLLVAVLMAVSTSLVGPMTFLGFLIAMLAYQLTDSHEHRLILPVAVLTGVVVLGGAFLVLRHILGAQGSVGIVIEVVGGSIFLIHLLRKGRL